MAKVLVIDDDESFRSTLVATLEKQGFQVFQAPGGAEGVQMARDHQPDLILCDVNMEGADGRLTLFALRRDPAIASIPFVLMSGVSLRADALPGTGRGADGFLLKPFTQEKLLATIEGCLSRVDQSAGAIERMKVIDNDARGVSRQERLLESLELIIEATSRVSTTDPQAAPAEIKRLATLAHESALRLKELIGGQWREVDSKGTSNSPKTPQ